MFLFFILLILVPCLSFVFDSIFLHFFFSSLIFLLQGVLYIACPPLVIEYTWAVTVYPSKLQYMWRELGQTIYLCGKLTMVLIH